MCVYMCVFMCVCMCVCMCGCMCASNTSHPHNYPPLLPNPDLCPMIDSSSSIKMVEGAWNRASSNRTYAESHDRSHDPL